MLDEVCSFCKKDKKHVKKLFQAEDAFICDQCVKKFRDTLASFDESTPGIPKQPQSPDPTNN